MVRQYVQVTDEQRMELIRLIHKEGYSISKASKKTEIPYDNAKAINRTYLKEKRVNKINYRQRYQKKTLNLQAVFAIKHPNEALATTAFCNNSDQIFQPSVQMITQQMIQNSNLSAINKSDGFNLQYQQLTPVSQQLSVKQALSPINQNYMALNSSPTQFLIPGIFRPQPQANRQGLFVLPLFPNESAHSPIKGFFNFEEYSVKIQKKIQSL